MICYPTTDINMWATQCMTQMECNMYNYNEPFELLVSDYLVYSSNFYLLIPLFVRAVILDK